MHISLVCAAASAALSAWLMGWPREGGYQLTWLVMAVLCAIGTRQFMKETDRRAKWCFGVLGALFMLCMGLGWRLESADRTGFDGLLLCLLLAACSGPAVGALTLWASRRLENLAPGKPLSPKKTFWVCFALIMAMWLPVQLAYFPCCFGYDLNNQIGQINHGPFNTHHPLLHTLIVGGFYVLGGALGSHTLGAWMYGTFQMLCVAGSMAYGLSHLARLRVPKKVIAALTLFFGLAPNHSLMSIGCTKDVLFAAAMTVSVIHLHKLWLDPTRIRRVKPAASLVIWLTLTSLLRNNAVYAIVLFAIPAVILIGKGSRRRLFAAIAAALILQSAAGTVMARATDAVPGAINEMLSVPAQQLARIYHKYGFDVPTGYEVVEWVPHADMYQSSRADFTKQHLKVTREGQLMGFAKFWIREIFHYPIEYIDAFLLNAKGYWFPHDTSFAVVYGEWPEALVGAIITEQYPIDVEFTSYIPPLRALYEHLFTRNNYQSVPGLSTLIHPATYSWLILWAIAWAIWRKNTPALMPMLLLAAYLATLFLGPCALIRYCYYLMIGAPLAVGTLCAKEG